MTDIDAREMTPKSTAQILLLFNDISLIDIVGNGGGAGG
jgi:hypothetical protein